MSSDDTPPPGIAELTDPRAMRALAHPLRLSMIARLRIHGPATATKLAGELDESSASTSYHLRVLAEHGFIVEAPELGSGRQRPWRAAHRGMRWETGTPDSPEHLAASRLLETTLRQHWTEVVDDYYRNEDDRSVAWQQAAMSGDWGVHVTLHEMHELRQQLQDVFDPYLRSDPAQRPSGARRVTFIAFGLPDPDPDDPADGADLS